MLVAIIKNIYNLYLNQHNNHYFSSKINLKIGSFSSNLEAEMSK